MAVPARADLTLDDRRAELASSIDATRSVLKAHQRSCRTALQFLADLEEKLEAAHIAQPKEAQRNGNGHSPGAH